jgi:hypothetical protein
VSDLLAPLPLKPTLIGVYTQPDEQALGAIAQIRPGARVGIVCNTAAGGERFAKQITTFTAVTTQTAVHPSDDQVRRLAAAVDVIVCSRSRTAQVRGLELAIPVIPLPFHVSPQAVGRIVDALGVGQELAVAV